MRRWVSLGGWCGPSLMLSKLGVRGANEELLPFDMVRATLDGITHFVSNGFGDEFFPAVAPGGKDGATAGSRFLTDPVSIWLLFRGQHTCFTHFDLNRREVVDNFRARFVAWDRMLAHGEQPVTFLRTVIATDPRDELNAIHQLQQALQQRSPRLDCRFVMVVHEQGVATQQLTPLSDTISVWALQRDPVTAAEQSLFDRTHSSYERIIRQMSSEASWPPSADTPNGVDGGFRFLPNNDLALIEGVPAFRGSCKGYGSTYTAAIGRCPYCGSADGHALHNAARWDSAKPWSEEEDAQLLSYIATGWDRVAAIEKHSLATGRSARETEERYRRVESLCG